MRAVLIKTALIRASSRPKRGLPSIRSSHAPSPFLYLAAAADARRRRGRVAGRRQGRADRGAGAAMMTEMIA
eukprot:364120-Prymnesium_polylepis.1